MIINKNEMKKNILLFAAALFLAAGFAKAETTNQSANKVSSITNAYSGGDGSEQSPFLISSKADMEALATTVENGETYENAYFLLTRNLTGANDTITTVIGKSYTLYFSGIFDGGKHEIAVDDKGVFGYIKNATIKNLGVSGCIKSYSYGTTYNFYAGAICGSAYSSDIINCYNQADISVKVKDRWMENSYVGGICGESANGGNIINCYNSGSISGSGSFSTVGGVCGDGYADFANCFAANEAIINEGGMYGSGRISVPNSADVTNCYALASMLINGELVTNGAQSNKNGQDEEITAFKNQQWIIENLGWDFDDVWRIPTNGGFPVLKNAPDPITTQIVSSLPNNDVLIGFSAGCLTISGILKDINITVLDMQGKTIFKQTSIRQEEVIQTSGWTKGMYLIIAQDRNNKIIKKAVIY